MFPIKCILNEGYWKKSKRNGIGIEIRESRFVLGGEWKDNTNQSIIDIEDIEFPKELLHLIMKTPFITKYESIK